MLVCPIKALDATVIVLTLGHRNCSNTHTQQETKKKMKRDNKASSQQGSCHLVMQPI